MVDSSESESTSIFGGDGGPVLILSSFLFCKAYVSGGVSASRPTTIFSAKATTFFLWAPLSFFSSPPSLTLSSATGWIADFGRGLNSSILKSSGCCDFPEKKDALRSFSCLSFSNLASGDLGSPSLYFGTTPGWLTARGVFFFNILNCSGDTEGSAAPSIGVLRSAGTRSFCISSSLFSSALETAVAEASILEDRDIELCAFLGLS
mmetsp:Transcript_18541/g.38583  ORF Transcript_18541/g.38583 Transcript_18541/m.38583 type:complete len:206 (-) Transcript_18541:224-841(-)